MTTTVFILPNLLTTGNLFFGFYSIVASINNDFKLACYSIIIATVFDLLDGKVAKLTNTDSNFGAHFDSLCDVVSFGLAPALLMYFWALKPFGKFGWIASFLFLSCAALRLARFNTNQFSIHYFQGLPSTMAAGLIASGVLYIIYKEIEAYKQVGLLLITFLVALLMISNFKYRNFKSLVLKKRPFYWLVFLVFCIIITIIHTELMLFGFYSSYMLFGWIFRSEEKS